MNEYKIEHFDVLKILPGMVIVVVTALATTWGNTILSQPQWVKEGENFILFYPLLVGILLYGFSVGTVFSAGQTAWKDIVDLAEENNPELKKALKRRPDLFPIILVILGAGILTICSLYVQIPPEMHWVLFITLLVIYTPIILALDYWGFEGGIKSIKRVRSRREQFES